MLTFAGTTDDGKLRVLVGLTAAELVKVQKNERVLPVNPRPGLWWALMVESEQRETGEPKVPGNAGTFMRNRYGVSNPKLAVMPAEEVAELLRCEQLVFHCSPDDSSDLIVVVERTVETLKASLPLLGIEVTTVEALIQETSSFSRN